MSAQGPVTDDRYPILPECEAPYHNTLRASQGCAGKKFHPRCTCPYAVALLAAYRQKARENYSSRAKSYSPTGRPPGRPATPVIPESAARIERPNLTAGACVTREGRDIMDKLMTASSPERMGATDAARFLCQVRCPVRDTCLAWATAAETPAGSWTGMYGGLTAAERRNRAVAVMVENHQSQQAKSR